MTDTSDNKIELIENKNPHITAMYDAMDRFNRRFTLAMSCMPKRAITRTKQCRAIDDAA